MHFYSTKAYKYVRKVWKNLLPHPSTITKWYSVVDGGPGFTKQTFNSIKLANEKEQVIINIVIDEMSIRQEAVYKNEQFFGGVDLGTCDEERSDIPVLAKHALVFMAVSLNSYWKIPLGCFLIDGLTGKKRANIITTCLKLVHKTGVTTFSETFDGASVNISMCTELGACFKFNDQFRPWFLHPSTGDKVFVFYDAFHMIKLVRNFFGEKGVLNYGKEIIKWDFIKNYMTSNRTKNFIVVPS